MRCGVIRLVLFDKTQNKSNDHNGSENKKQDFRNLNCTSSNSAKTKKGGDQCDD